MRIPLIDLKAQYRAIKPELDHAIQAVLELGQFILGPEVEAFERELAAYCGVAYAVGVASGTDALELALRACGIGPGQEVLTTAYSFIATAEAIVSAGAVPVFVDIDPATYNLDVSQVDRALTARTKAILPVHLYGLPCRMDAVLDLAKAHRLRVVEDCAQAVGAVFRGRRVGSFGDAAALSFYPSKNLGAYGDGGMVLTNDQAVAEQVRLLRAHGSRERYRHLVLGTNSRLDELQAAVLRVKLCHLERWTEARRRHAAAYREAFRRHHLDDIVLPQELPGSRHVYSLYSIRVKERDRLAAALAQQGIETQVAYPSSLPAQPALQPYALQSSPCPVSDAVAKDVLALPIYPELTPETIERVVLEIARVRVPS
jgi:dTDP-4-amino-4,6-dideoxygalactose transaminase